MRVTELMTTGVETIGPDDTLDSAAAKMRAVQIGALAVVDAGRLAGVITDRDIVVRSTADGCDPIRSRVRSAMTSPAVTCPADADVYAAARLMEEHAVGRLFVVGDGDRLLGALSVDDLPRASAVLTAAVLARVRPHGAHRPGGARGAAVMLLPDRGA